MFALVSIHWMKCTDKKFANLINAIAIGNAQIKRIE